MDLRKERSPSLIAAEINTIKEQTGKILLVSAIEIGRRLREAKSMLYHGEWLKWLDESVNYTERTAQRLMRIADEYRYLYQGQHSESLDAHAQAQELPNLNFSQALVLLGIPKEERAQFIAEMDVESLSIRELQKAVQERSQALQEKEQALEEKAELQKIVHEQVTKISELSVERDEISRKAEELAKSQRELEAKTYQLGSELKKLKEGKEEQALIQRLSKNLAAAYNKARANKVAFLYEDLERTFKELVWALGELAVENPEVYEVYKDKVIDFLTKGLKETI